MHHTTGILLLALSESAATPNDALIVRSEHGIEETQTTTTGTHASHIPYRLACTIQLALLLL